MKTTGILEENAKDLWMEASKKDFVVQMAKGTLSKERFQNYMIRDYLYLLDYIKILKDIRDLSDKKELTDFMNRIIEDTESETYRVHVPNMRKIGISDEDITKSTMDPVIKEYLDYMRRVLNEYGLKAGLTALLQCSWAYAFIGLKLYKEYPNEIERSAYKNWFDAYTCKEYIGSNDLWIDIIDKETSEITEEELKDLCKIFRHCAEFENRFWDTL